MIRIVQNRLGCGPGFDFVGVAAPRIEIAGVGRKITGRDRESDAMATAK